MVKSIVDPVALKELVETAERAAPGDFLEVGVYQGGSAAALWEVAMRRGCALWLFDTFTGIPERTDGVDIHQVGDFGDTSAEAVRKAIPGAIVIEGIFPETLPQDCWNISLAHIDCDQYASTLATCLALEPLMAPGGVMIFDDFPALRGAQAAVDQVFGPRVEKTPAGKARVWFPNPGAPV